MIERDELTGWLARLPELRIGLIGDLFLDRYLEIDPAIEEVSVETGLQAHQVTRVRNSPGALGTVLKNLTALGATQLRPFSVIGDDGHGDDLLRELIALRVVDVSGVLRDRQRLTPTYTKPLVVAAGAPPRELSRLDVRSRSPIGEATLAQIAGQIRSAWDEVDGWIVLDQLPAGEEGVAGPSIRALLAELGAADPSKLVYCDSRANIGDFRGGVLKTNHLECFAAAGLAPVDDVDEVLRLATRRADELGLALHCTIGDAGAVVAAPGTDAQLVAGFAAPEPVDIVGAGDAATSGYVAAALAGATPAQAACVGNLVASITVQQIGCTGTATPSQVLARWEETLGATSGDTRPAS